MELLEIKMEKYKLSRFLPHNKILDYIMALDEDQDGLTTFMIYNADNYGVYLITLLDEIAKKKHTSFWYGQLGDLCMVYLHYVDGARLSALFYFIKAHELDSKDTSIKRSAFELFCSISWLQTLSSRTKASAVSVARRQNSLRANSSKM